MVSTCCRLQVAQPPGTMGSGIFYVCSVTNEAGEMLSWPPVIRAAIPLAKYCLFICSWLSSRNQIWL